MLKNKIEELGKPAYSQSLKYKVPHKRKTPEQAILGAIDFEYQLLEDRDRLISVQLSIEGNIRIFYITDEESKTFGIDELRELILSLLVELKIKPQKDGKMRKVYLASYYSTAELSQLKDFWNKASVRNVTPKIVNIVFPLKKRKTRKDRKNEGYFMCSLIDIYHFFVDMKTETGKKSLEAVSNEFKECRKLGGKMSIEGVGGNTEDYWKSHMLEFKDKYPVEFEKYALQDVIITEALLRAYRKKEWEELKVDLLQAPTNGAIATTFFRSFEMKEGEVFGNTNIPARKFILECSHGAVMVALKRGKFWSIYENDFTGFYGYSMRNAKLLPRNAEDIIPASNLKQLLSGYDGWAKVRFEFPKKYNEKKVFPTLPVQEYIPLNRVSPSITPTSDNGSLVVSAKDLIREKKQENNNACEARSKKSSLILFPRTGVSYCTVCEIRGAMAFGCKIEFLDGWYYTEGTNKFSDFAKKEIALRAKARTRGDKVGEAIHKSLPNHLVGKLFQHKGGFEIERAQDIADYLEEPLTDVISGKREVSMEVIEEDIERRLEEGLEGKAHAPRAIKKLSKKDPRLALCLRIKKNGVEITSKTRIGACWLPEVWSLILGRARAALWWVVNQYGLDPVHLSTDSFHDVNPLAGELDTPFGAYLIHTTKEKPEVMIINRTKLYLHGERVAQHAVHLPPAQKELVRKMITDAVKAKYDKTSTNTLRSAALKEEAFGGGYEKEMQFDPRWDNKVKIEADGSYRAWECIEEYFTYVREEEEAWRKKEND